MDDRFNSWMTERVKNKFPFWSEIEYLTSTTSSAEEVGVVERKPFFAKIDSPDSDGLTVWITDFVVLWTESLTKGEFERRLKALNKNLETDADTMITEVREMLLGHRRDQARATIDGRLDGESSITITFRTKVDGLPLKWESELRRAKAEEFYEQIMKPLLSTVAQFQRRETALVGMLEEKDRENDQRKYGGRNAKVTETPKFRSRDWTVTDMRSKKFLRMQHRLRSDTLARDLVSNELYFSICASEPYVRENEMPSSDDELPPAVPSTTSSPDNKSSSQTYRRRRRRGNTDDASDSEHSIGETSAAVERVDPRASPEPSQEPAAAAAAAAREPSPPAPPPTHHHKKRKPLRL